MSAPVVTDSRDTAAIPAERVVRWAAVATTAIAAIQLLSYVADTFVRGVVVDIINDPFLIFEPWSADFAFWFASYASPIVILLTVVVAGVACYAHRSWGRKLFLIAFPFWIIGSWIGGVRGGLLLYWFQNENGAWAFWVWRLQTEGSPYVTIYAMFFASILTRPQVKALFRPRSDRGFEPVMREKA